MLKRLTPIAVPVGIVMIVVMLVIPLPAVLLDLLIAANITGALLILLTAMFVVRPLDFSAFPAVLLVMTLFRLALNVSATRLVLVDGYAGKVIDTFGHFVVGGSLIVGLIIFAILLVIQFVVITNGAGRVAEVGARFTLDAMPGKQMAIDADLNSGLIDEEEARRRRAEVHAEADFYGAMDGASKFVKGDAIAAIVITLVNLIGGFAVGMAQRGMSPGDAVSTYSLLSVGDGLVSQIPALLLSVATGLVVTRAAGEDDMGSDIMRQITAHRMPLRMAGFSAMALCLIPGLPKIPFILTGGVLLLMSSRVEEHSDAVPIDELEPAAPTDTPELIAAEIQVDPLGLELSVDMIDLVDPQTGGDLLSRVKSLRRKIAADLGVVVPPVRTRDSIDLPSHTYAIKLFDIDVARGEAPPGRVLAIGEFLGSLPGEPTKEPVFGLEAKWIPAELAPQAELGGATVVERSAVITTHLAEVVRQYSSRLLGREDVRMLIDVVKRGHPALVEELTGSLNIGQVQRVLQALLDEGVSVRDLVRIFDALSLRAQVTKEHEALVEAARASLGGAVMAPYTVEGVLPALSLDPRLEQQMVEALRQTEEGSVLALDPEVGTAAVTSLARLVAQAENENRRPVLVCAPQIRPALRRLVRPVIPRLAVLSYVEVADAPQIHAEGTVTLAAPEQVLA
jgi:flagellar biosynthesis protein FlhA